MKRLILCLTATLALVPAARAEKDYRLQGLIIMSAARSLCPRVVITDRQKMEADILYSRLTNQSDVEAAGQQLNLVGGQIATVVREKGMVDKLCVMVEPELAKLPK